MNAQAKISQHEVTLVIEGTAYRILFGGLFAAPVNDDGSVPESNDDGDAGMEEWGEVDFHHLDSEAAAECAQIESVLRDAHAKLGVPREVDMDGPRPDYRETHGHTPHDSEDNVRFVPSTGERIQYADADDASEHNLRMMEAGEFR